MAEAKEIYDCGNSWLAYTPALHMLRESGTLVGLLDLLDERRLCPGEAATLAALLLDGDSGGGSGSSGTGSNTSSSDSTLPAAAAAAALPDWQYEPEAFEASLRAKCRQQQMQVYNPHIGCARICMKY